MLIVGADGHEVEVPLATKAEVAAAVVDAIVRIENHIRIENHQSQEPP